MKCSNPCPPLNDHFTAFCLVLTLSTCVAVRVQHCLSPNKQQPLLCISVGQTQLWETGWPQCWHWGNAANTERNIHPALYGTGRELMVEHRPEHSRPWVQYTAQETRGNCTLRWWPQYCVPCDGCHKDNRGLGVLTTVYAELSSWEAEFLCYRWFSHSGRLHMYFIFIFGEKNLDIF